MPCGKVFKFRPKDPRDIPLPEMVRISLECQSDKVYKCYKDNENHVIVGSKDQDEAIQLC